MIMTFKVITIKRDTYIIIMIMIMTFIPVIIMIKRSVHTIANTHHAQECEDEGSGEEILYFILYIFVIVCYCYCYFYCWHRPRLGVWRQEQWRGEPRQGGRTLSRRSPGQGCDSICKQDWNWEYFLYVSWLCIMKLLMTIHACDDFPPIMTCIGRQATNPKLKW